MDPQIEFIDLRMVRGITGLSSATIYRAVKASRFPRPVPLSVRKSKWIKSEVVAWRDARIAERGGTQ